MQYKPSSNFRRKTFSQELITCRQQRAKSGTGSVYPVVPALLLLFFLTATFPGSAAAGPPGPGGGPPPLVTVAPIVVRDVNPPAEYVGHVEAIQAVDLYAQVAGNIQSIHFKEGQRIQEGELLFSIEPDLYQARFSAAKAALGQARAGYEGTRADVDVAQSYVEGAEADLDAVHAAFARADKYLKRMRSVDKRSIVQANLETAESNFLQSKARVTQAKVLVRQRKSQVLQARAQLKQSKAGVLQAQADLDVARINLGYTQIRSPISGRIGKAAATRGNYVSPGAGPLARIVQMDPIRVVYSISENDLAAIQQALADVGRAAGRLLAPELRLADGKRFKGSGQVDFVDNEVDPATGTIAIRAVFDNPAGLLVPGQYVTVLVKASAPKLLPVVPQGAVQQDHEGSFVLVVDKQNRVGIRRVKTGPVVGVNWAIESGLNGKERVIVQGIQKVRPGQIVKVTIAGKSQGR